MRTLALALLFFQPPTTCEDQLVLRWNAFANAANVYVHTRPAKESEHLKQKRHLEKLWEQVDECECF